MVEQWERVTISKSAEKGASGQSVIPLPFRCLVPDRVCELLVLQLQGHPVRGIDPGQERSINCLWGQ